MHFSESLLRPVLSEYWFSVVDEGNLQIGDLEVS